MPLQRTTSSDVMLGGVCGGLARWLGWDSTVVRVAYVLLTLFTAFSGVLVYIILWIVMPPESEDWHEPF